ncbi:hypothetical protein PM082_001807 [Marasmius tenuissimus]|nr:hypothetical protein PM082_001807 [Marasmius tenuissimus]
MITFEFVTFLTSTPVNLSTAITDLRLSRINPFVVKHDNWIDKRRTNPCHSAIMLPPHTVANADPYIFKSGESLVTGNSWRGEAQQFDPIPLVSASTAQLTLFGIAGDIPKARRLHR